MPKFKGFIDTELRYLYDVPVRVQQPTLGFLSNVMFEPMLGGFVRPRGAGGWFTDGPLFPNPVQGTIYVCRPNGMTQIVKNSDIGTLPSATALFVNSGAPNLGVFNPGNWTGSRNTMGLVRIPPSPGVFEMEAVAGPTVIGGSIRVGGQGSAAVRADLVPASGVGLNYVPVPGRMTPDAYQFGVGFGYNGRSWARNNDGSIYVGVGAACNTFDLTTGENYTIQGTATYPRYFTWRAGTISTTVLYSMSDWVDEGPGFANMIARIAAGAYTFHSWHGGILLMVNMGLARNGPTGQLTEILVVNLQRPYGNSVLPISETYRIVRINAYDAFTASMLANNTNPSTNYSAAIDKHGILYLYANGKGAPHTSRVFSSFKPMGWALPRVQYVPRSAIALPCFNTCEPVTF